LIVSWRAFLISCFCVRLSVHIRYLDVVAYRSQEVSVSLAVQRPNKVDQASLKVSELVQFHRARVAASKVTMLHMIATHVTTLFLLIRLHRAT